MIYTLPLVQRQEMKVVSLPEDEWKCLDCICSFVQMGPCSPNHLFAHGRSNTVSVKCYSAYSVTRWHHVAMAMLGSISERISAFQIMEFKRALVWTFQGHFKAEDPALSVIRKSGGAGGVGIQISNWAIASTTGIAHVKLRGADLQGTLGIPSTQLLLYLSLSCDGAGLFTYRHLSYSTHIYLQINSYHLSCKMVFQIYITDFYQEVSPSLAVILRWIRKYSEKSMSSSE